MARKPTPCGQRIQPLFARSEISSPKCSPPETDDVETGHRGNNNLKQVVLSGSDFGYI